MLLHLHDDAQVTPSHEFKVSFHVRNEWLHGPIASF